MNEISNGQKLLRLYLFSTISLFTYKAYQKYINSDNYFSAVLTFMDDSFTEFLLYNMIMSVAIILYKISVFIFYVEIKENQTMKLVQKLWYKLFDLFFFIFVTRANFGILMFSSVIIVFLSFILHNYAIFRANFLIHTHSFGSLNLHYRVLAHFLLLIFIDYEIVTETFFWFFRDGQDQAVFALFVYYTTSISMSIIEPFVCFFIDFYERYTEISIPNSDEWEAFLSVVINVPRLIVQIIMAVFITFKFGFTFFLFITIIQMAVELSRTVKSYMKIQKLTQTMKNLKQLSPEDLQKMHDTTCMICFRDMTSATILPCQHAFHVDCLRQWIIKNSNHFCPKCKKSFDFDNPKLREKERQRQQNQNVNIQGTLEKLRQKMAEQRQAERLDPMNMNQKSKMKEKQENYEVKRPIIELNSVGQNHIATNINPIKKGRQTYKREDKHRYDKIGSIPYGLPTEAVYKRSHKLMQKRREMIKINEKMVKFMKLQPAKQILFVTQKQNID